MRKDLQREGKGVASRYFQLLSGHAAIGPYLAETTKTIRFDKRWWCGSGEQQSRHHLFANAGPGRSRSGNCGGASGRPVSRNTRERQPSAAIQGRESDSGRSKFFAGHRGRKDGTPGG